MGKKTVNAMAIPELLPTGDKALDTALRRLWDAEDFDGLVSALIDKIAATEDGHPSPEELRLLHALRRNEILAYVIRQTSEFDDPSEFVLNFESLAPDDAECPFSKSPKSLSVVSYLRNPDTIPCANCTASWRKYFCGVIIRPKI